MKSRVYFTGLAVFLSIGFFLPGDLTASVASARGKKATRKAAVPKPLPPEFISNVQLFYNGRYKEALDGFDKLDRNGFCTDKTHYFMGLCYHYMNQLAAAEQQYQVVYTYSKDPTLRYQAQLGYSQVAKYAANRTYSGQGNLFAKFSTGGGGSRGGPWGGGGGGGGGG